MTGHSGSPRVRPWAPGAPPHLQGPGRVTVTASADRLGAGEADGEAVRGRVAWAVAWAPLGWDRESGGLRPNQGLCSWTPSMWGRGYTADTWTPPRPGQARQDSPLPLGWLRRSLVSLVREVSPA